LNARYGGWCKAGRHAVVPGDQITKSAGGWSHPSCAAASGSTPPARQRFSDRALAGQDAPRTRYRPDGREDPSYFAEHTMQVSDERARGEQERSRMNADVAQGMALADHIRATRDLLGEEAAAAEEYAWEMRLGDSE